MVRADARVEIVIGLTTRRQRLGLGPRAFYRRPHLLHDADDHRRRQWCSAEDRWPLRSRAAAASGLSGRARHWSRNRLSFRFAGSFAITFLR